MFINKDKKESGFTLIEIAVVLVLVGLLLGSFIGSLNQRIESTQREKTKNQLNDIRTALLGFVSARGRLPCPTSTTGGGFEEPFGGSDVATPCTIIHGFVPGKTLGIDGAYNLDNLLLDVWGNPYRYSVSDRQLNAFTTAYTAPGAGGMADIGMANLQPDLVICDADSGSANVCIGANTIILGTAFVVLSLGKDGSDFVTNLAPNSDQGENAGEATVAANGAGENLAYTVSNGNAFVSKSYSATGSAAGFFDDMIVWESQYVIYARMLEAGHVIEADPLP